MQPGFDHDALQDRLIALSARQRLAFAVLCYFAVEPHYRAFVDETGWGDAELMHGWGVQLWDVAVGTTLLDGPALQAMQAQGLTLVPDHDEFDSPLTSAALDAAVVLMCAMAAAESGSSTEAAHAGSQAIAIADLLAQESENMHPQDPQLEEKIWRHPLMQAELSRQDNVLNMLESGADWTARSLESLRPDPDAV